MTSQAEIQAARLLLERLGVTIDDLLATTTATDMPTFDTYIARVSEAVTAGARRVYGTYWNRIRECWGTRRLDEPTALEIQQLAEKAKQAVVVVRRNARGGRHAAEHTIAALRCLYKYAVADGLIPERANPAIRVAKPRRYANSRRALLDSQLGQINTIAATTGNDPDLDTLLLRLHVETACRRGGALALRRIDLDPNQCLIRLREKGETDRWQPISPTLTAALLNHWQQRGNIDPASTAPLLRQRNRHPITRRRYDYLWHRIGQHLPWVATQGISTHWLRHTTLTWVERHFGYGVARAYAGHDDHTAYGATATYIRADLYEVTQALAALSGEPHPLLHADAPTTRAGESTTIGDLDAHPGQRRDIRPAA